MSISDLRAYQLLARIPDALAVYHDGETHLSTEDLHARLSSECGIPYRYWEPDTLIEAFDPIKPGPHGWPRVAFAATLTQLNRRMDR